MADLHKLFRDFPLVGTTELSTGAAPTPYHVYQGHGMLITGTADLAATTKATIKEDVHPVTTKSGRAALGIFVCDFEDASHGPHLELQVCALVSKSPGQTISNNPYAMVAAMIAHPEWGTLCLHLWNNTADVVAYNKEYLGLDAAYANGQITRGGGRKIFEFTDEAPTPILNGNVSERRRSSPWALAQFMACAGFLKTVNANARPYFESAVINRKGGALAENRRAQTFTAPDTTVLQRFDPSIDTLNIQSDALGAYDFTPLCLEHFSPFRFVYLYPEETI